VTIQICAFCRQTFCWEKSFSQQKGDIVPFDKQKVQWDRYTLFSKLNKPTGWSGCCVGFLEKEIGSLHPMIHGQDLLNLALPCAWRATQNRSFAPTHGASRSSKNFKSWSLILFLMFSESLLHLQ